MLVAEDLNLGARLQPRPLTYPILTEAFILAILFIVFPRARGNGGRLIAGKAIAASVPTISGGGVVGLACVGPDPLISLIPRAQCRQPKPVNTQHGRHNSGAPRYGEDTGPR